MFFQEHDSAGKYLFVKFRELFHQKLNLIKLFQTLPFILVALCNAERRYYEICRSIIHTGMSDQTEGHSLPHIIHRTDPNWICSKQPKWNAQLTPPTGQPCLWWLDQKPMIDNKNFCWFSISYLITSNGKTLNLDYLKFLKMFLRELNIFLFSIMSYKCWNRMYIEMDSLFKEFFFSILFYWTKELCF